MSQSAIRNQGRGRGRGRAPIKQEPKQDRPLDESPFRPAAAAPALMSTGTKRTFAARKGPVEQTTARKAFASAAGFAAGEEASEWVRLFGYALGAPVGHFQPVFEMVAIGPIHLIQFREYKMVENRLEHSDRGLALTLGQFRALLDQTDYLSRDAVIEASKCRIECTITPGGVRLDKYKQTGRVNSMFLSREQMRFMPKPIALALFREWRSEYESLVDLERALWTAMDDYVFSMCKHGSPDHITAAVRWNYSKFLAPLFGLQEPEDKTPFEYSESVVALLNLIGGSQNPEALDKDPFFCVLEVNRLVGPIKEP